MTMKHQTASRARAAGRFADAVVALKRDLAREPDGGEGWSLLAQMLFCLDRGSETEATLRRAALILDDSHASLRSRPPFNRALARARAGDLAGGMVDAETATVIDPSQARNWKLLATLRDRLDDPNGAASALREAIRLEPDEIEHELSLTELLRRAGKLAEAVEQSRDLATRAPDDARAWINHGTACETAWLNSEAARAFRRVSCLSPERMEYALRDALSLPAIPRSVEDIEIWRKRYASGIERLSRLPPYLEDPGAVLGPPSFYLAYHDRDDRPLMEALGRMFLNVAPSLSHTAPNLDGWRGPKAEHRRLRVGFVSEYFSSHTIGKLYHGLLRHLDRKRFEIFLIHMPAAAHDTFRDYLDGMADHSINLPAGQIEQRHRIAALNLDVLFYPDIGMTASTYFLAFSRLAPVQAVAWGHPNTTGLKTMDYFISSAALEPPGADANYRERLIRLTNLPCFYEPAPMKDAAPARSSWGLPETGTLYACPQSLFKLHPDFDAILAEIAERDQDGQIVLLEALHESQTARLLERWTDTHPILLERVTLLPRQPFPRFLEFLARVDVLLDPIHFGSGNTMYEAMVRGTPIVTWPGRFMRARIVAAAYAIMNIADAPVVTHIEDYAAAAIALGQDPERRADLRRRTRLAATEKLFADMSVVRDFETFLEASVAAREAGGILPAGWRPKDSAPASVDGDSRT
jgi:protein O-GlcNAc transferase